MNPPEVLNVNEKKIFRLFVTKEEVSLQAIAALFRETQSGASVRVKYFSAKVAPHGWIVEKLTGVGRGVKAVYRMRKRFEP